MGRGPYLYPFIEEEFMSGKGVDLRTRDQVWDAMVGLCDDLLEIVTTIKQARTRLDGLSEEKESEELPRPYPSYEWLPEVAYGTPLRSRFVNTYSKETQNGGDWPVGTFKVGLGSDFQFIETSLWPEKTARLNDMLGRSPDLSVTDLVQRWFTITWTRDSKGFNIIKKISTEASDASRLG